MSIREFVPFVPAPPRPLGRHTSTTIHIPTTTNITNTVMFIRSRRRRHSRKNERTTFYKRGFGMKSFGRRPPESPFGKIRYDGTLSFGTCILVILLLLLRQATPPPPSQSTSRILDTTSWIAYWPNFRMCTKLHKILMDCSKRPRLLGIKNN